ncbi:MAG: signal peptidase II [Anaerolineaceae bacterium]|nr:signal peptidase II [Anaerolineaceae bacterium]
MRPALRRWLLLGILITLVVAVDQVTKHWVVDHLVLGQAIQPIPAISDLFEIVRSHNAGAAFGFLPQAGDIFLVVAILAVIGMIFFYPRIPDGARITRIATGLVVGGALGNALDRLQYGSVIDFIHYQIPGVISNVSNLADHAIVFGVLLIFLESWRLDREKGSDTPTADTPQTDDSTPSPQA